MPGTGRRRRALGGRLAGLGLARAVRPPVASLGQAEPDDGDGRGLAMLASVVGLAAVLIVQTQAKADLSLSLPAR